MEISYYLDFPSRSVLINLVKSLSSNLQKVSAANNLKIENMIEGIILSIRKVPLEQATLTQSTYILCLIDHQLQLIGYYYCRRFSDKFRDIKKKLEIMFFEVNGLVLGPD